MELLRAESGRKFDGIKSTSCMGKFLGFKAEPAWPGLAPIDLPLGQGVLSLLSAPGKSRSLATLAIITLIKAGAGRERECDEDPQFQLSGLRSRVRRFSRRSDACGFWTRMIEPNLLFMRLDLKNHKMFSKKCSHEFRMLICFLFRFSHYCHRSEESC